MLEILTYQVIAAGLGVASIGTADWLYDRGRIRQRPHDLWVDCFEHDDLLAFAYLDHRCVPRHWFVQCGVNRRDCNDNVPLDIPEPAKGSDRPKTGTGASFQTSSRQPVSSDVASFCTDAAAETSYLTGPISRRVASSSGRRRATQMIGRKGQYRLL
jgi:hypothetical protein